jgi:hypothetical protein
MKTRRITLIWSYNSLLYAVNASFSAGEIAKVPLHFYAQPAWRRAVWAGVDALVLREGQPLNVGAFEGACPEAKAATDALWKAMKDV